MDEGKFMVTRDKPRLLIIVNVFSPDRGGGGAIFSDLCYGLVERGYDVTVRCAYPYYPEWKDKSGNNGLRIQRYDEKGVHVERYGIFIPSNPRSLVQRLIYEASFFFSLIRSLPSGRTFDLVMTYCPLVGAVGFAAINKVIYRKPLWLNVQDLSADAAAVSGIAKGKFVPKMLRSVQQFLFNRADVWSTISPVMVTRLERFRRRNQEILYLPNWLNASLAEEICKLPSKIGRSLNQPIHLLYAGNIGRKQDLLRFCEILHQSNIPFEFLVHGNGAEASSFESWINRTRDPRFRFGPFLDESTFAAALHKADLFVITEKTASEGSFIPCKTIAGIASGTPILAVCDGDSPLGYEIRDNHLGPYLNWETAQQTPILLKEISEKRDTVVTWQLNTVKRATFYERGKIIDGFAAAIMNVLRKSNSSKYS